MLSFIIIGSGYRAEFYIRVANENKDKLNLLGVLVRNKEKFNYLKDKYNINVSLNEDELLNLKPDFIVVCVDKLHILDTSLYYANLGYPILMETPAALNLLDINKFKDAINSGLKIQVAEQYIRMPYISSIINEVNSNIIGEVTNLELSYAHEYHAISIAREILKGKVKSVTGKTYDNQIVKTCDRYNTYYSGEIKSDKETHAIIEYDNKKTLFYSFSSEEYRSPIRKQYIHIKGVRGEIINDTIYYLANSNKPCVKKIIYKNDINQDMYAICSILLSFKDYIEKDIEVYPNRYAIEDSYVAYLIRNIETNEFKLMNCEEEI